MSAPMALEDLTWHEDAMDALRKAAAAGKPFDAFDLTEAGLRDPGHPNHWGSLFKAGQAAGVIVWAGFHRSRRPSRAGGVCAVWVGKLYDEAAA